MRKRALNTDLIGEAIKAHYSGVRCAPVHTFLNGKRDTDIFPKIFFRSIKEMSRLERRALGLCRGEVLDVGAGAGAHSLALQDLGFKVTALERSASAASVLRARGVQQVICRDIMKVERDRYDTILLLMNGLGLMGSVDKTLILLKHLRAMLKPGGQIIGDSSDVRYLYPNRRLATASARYYGEVEFTLRFNGKTSPPLPWVYFDKKMLASVSDLAGLNCEILMTARDQNYLACITKK